MPNWKKLITSGSDALLSNITVDNSIQGGSITGSIDFNNLTNSPTLVSGSSQISISQTTGYIAFSSSIDSHLDVNISTINTTVTNISSSLNSKIDTEKSRIDAILLASDADKDSFAEIVSLINSVDTDSDTAFASFYTASTGRLGSLEVYTASLQSTNLISGSSQVSFNGITDKPTLVSGSSQVSFNGITDKPTLVSGSSQINYNSLTGVPSGIVSSSAQINSGSFSGSFQGNGSGLTGVQTSVVETATVVDSFSNETSLTVLHNFGTKNVIAYVYDSTDNLIIPASLVTTNENELDISFSQTTSGRVVVAKGGHIVSGSIGLFTVREQVSGSSSYTVNHNLNEDYPIVQIYDTDKKQVIPAEITSSNSNQVQVEFNSVFNGTIVVKK
jgi:hypothetical protein